VLRSERDGVDSNLQLVKSERDKLSMQVAGTSKIVTDMEHEITTLKKVCCLSLSVI
jgi:hypothetical protein